MDFVCNWCILVTFCGIRAWHFLTAKTCVKMFLWFFSKMDESLSSMTRTPESLQLWSLIGFMLLWILKLHRILSWTHQSLGERRGWCLCWCNAADCAGLRLVQVHRGCFVTTTIGIFISQQVRGDVCRMCLCVLSATGVVTAGGFLRAAAPLVLPPEAPELGAPVFPPLEG